MGDDIILYGFGANDRSGKVRWIAHELGIPVDDRLLAGGEHRKAPYLDLNPYGVVPTTIFRGRAHIESTATCAFLAEQFPAARLVVTPEESERADYLQWIALFGESLEGRLVEVLLGGRGVLPAAFAALQGPPVARRLEVLRERFSRGGFLVADRFTVADVMAGYSLRLAVQAKLLTFEDVSAYLRPLMDRPAAKAARFFSGIE